MMKYAVISAFGSDFRIDRFAICPKLCADKLKLTKNFCHFI